MTTYYGARDENGVCHVFADDDPLPPRLDLRNHSPTGFEWGYGGSGPAQLALAILADHLDSTDLALRLYQAFKREVIAGLDRTKPWTMTDDYIDVALGKIQLQMAANP